MHRRTKDILLCNTVMYLYHCLLLFDCSDLFLLSAPCRSTGKPRQFKRKKISFSRRRCYQDFVRQMTLILLKGLDLFCGHLEICRRRHLCCPSFCLSRDGSVDCGCRTSGCPQATKKSLHLSTDPRNKYRLFPYLFS